jgi:hypothetical protein
MNLKGFVRKRSVLTEVYSGISLEGLRKTIHNLRTAGIVAEVRTGHISIDTSASVCLAKKKIY